MQARHVVEEDRFAEAVEAMRSTVERARLLQMATDVAEELQESALTWLMFFSPRSGPDTLFSTGHDHTAIEDGWERGRVEWLADAVEVTISNTSEHVDWQRSGTEKHDIPLSTTMKPRRSSMSQIHQYGQLQFWLGAPLKWKVHNPRFAKTPGFYNFVQVEHPGFQPWGGRDFVEEAADEARPEMEHVFSRGMEREAFRPLEEFFKS